MSVKKVVVKNCNEEAPIAVEIIAESIKEIADGMRKIRTGRLTDRALYILISKSSGVEITEIERVMDAMSNLEAVYLKKQV